MELEGLSEPFKDFLDFWGVSHDKTMFVLCVYVKYMALITNFKFMPYIFSKANRLSSSRGTPKYSVASFPYDQFNFLLRALTHPREKKSETKRRFGERRAEMCLPKASLEGGLRWDSTGEIRKKPCSKPHG